MTKTIDPRNVPIVKQTCSWQNDPAKPKKWRYQRISIRAKQSYTKTGAFAQQLIAIALADFPDLDLTDTEFVIYGGRRIKGFFGLEFNIDPDHKAPADYDRVTTLENKK